MHITLDKKDWKILGELDVDARQSYSKIAKKVGLSKEVVRYRIKNLENKRVIKGYRFFVNTKMLGYEAFKWYLQLENTTEESLKKIIEELDQEPLVAWVSTFTGRWDLGIAFLCQSTHQFNNLMNKFLFKYSSQIRNSTYTIELDIYNFRRKGLFKKKGVKENILYFGGEQNVKTLNKKELIILNELSKHPTMGLVDLYKNTQFSVDVIRYHLDKFRGEGLLQGTELDINYEKLGVEWHKIFINRKRLTIEDENKFLSFLKHHKNVLEIIYCLGQWDTELNIEVNNGIELHQLIMELKNKFPEMIKDYETVKIHHNYKFNFFPMGEELLKELA